MNRTHTYEMTINWSDLEKGTIDYKGYSRNHIIEGVDKYDQIKASSDPNFLGDKNKYNPEELFLSSIASCHMLWYLHLCTTHNIIVSRYTDRAYGVMSETSDGSGRFTSVTLNPEVYINDESLISKAHELHHEANKMCFIANSCNFTIKHHPVIKVKAL